MTNFISNFEQKITKLLKESTKNVSFSQIVSILQSKLPKLIIQEPRGSTNKWGSTQPIPFDYGELPELINPADGMGWDVLVSPDADKNSPDLRIAGVVKIAKDAEKIPKPNGNKQGNHKLILGLNGRISNEAMKELKHWFSTLKAFETPTFFNQGEINIFDKILNSPKETNEDWERATLGNHKLTHVKDDRYGGIAVGRTAKKTFENS